MRFTKLPASKDQLIGSLLEVRRRLPYFRSCEWRFPSSLLQPLESQAADVSALRFWSIMSSATKTNRLDECVKLIRCESRGTIALDDPQ